MADMQFHLIGAVPASGNLCAENVLSDLIQPQDFLLFIVVIPFPYGCTAGTFQNTHVITSS
jgi:hypothetical protein